MPSASEIALLFDVDTTKNLNESESSDYGVTAKGDAPVGKFEDKIKDITAMMEHEPPLDDDLLEEIPAPKPKAAKKEVPKKIEPEPAPEIDEEEIIASSVKKATRDKFDDDLDLAEEKEVEKEVEEEITQEDVKEILEERGDKNVTEGNPLNLSGPDLVFFNTLKDKHPQFKLYNGNIGYKDFYRYKVYVLRDMLGRFPVLNLKSNRKEIINTDLDHFIGTNQIPTPELIRKKINDCIKSKIRVSVLLAEAYEQIFAWERVLELLGSKLWKDHESRGAHKREALILEHLYDVDSYYHELEGFVQSAKTIDGLLHAASESLSRQLACITMKEPSASIRDSAEKDPELDVFDEVDHGKRITAPGRSGVVKKVDMGTLDDDDLK